jgi:protein adenylyltransferase
MKSSNPSVIPRNHQVEKALEAAVEEGDYTVLKRLLYALSNPYNYLKVNEEYMCPPDPSSVPYVTYCGT